ncbi:Cof-type HAD-IIB family hydrolase [symbiont of Argiope bruennichi]|uniref:HAD family hydrolase n=1 Tax=symbiont of Argiope bruennichi TaxID=2810479 RepID=UPI003DA55EC8
MCKIFCVDLDGTLLSWRKKISKKDLNALITVQQNGTKVLICTGKSELSAQKYVDLLCLKKFLGGLICFNGAKLLDYNNFQASYKSYINLNNFWDQINKLKKNFYLILYFEDKAFFSSNNFFLKKFLSWKTNNLFFSFKKLKNQKNFSNLMKILILSPHLSKKKKNILKEFSKNNNLTFIFNNYFSCEINNLNVNKKVPLSIYCDFYKIEKKHVFACGNGKNDLEMLKYAGTSIVTKNASKEVKKIASFVTLSNNNSGVAHAIKTFF